MRSLVVSFVFAAVLLGACTARLTPPKIEVETSGPVTLKVEKPEGKGTFCPPGQAKKGRC